MTEWAKTKTSWWLVLAVAAISLSILGAGALVKTSVRVEAGPEIVAAGDSVTAAATDPVPFVSTATIRQTQGSWFYLEGDYQPSDLGPGDFITNTPLLGDVTSFTLGNGTVAEGDPNGLFIRFSGNPGYVYLLGPTGTRWAYYEFGPGSITNNGRSFTFRVRVLDTQIARFRDSERVWFEFHFWPK